MRLDGTVRRIRSHWIVVIAASVAALIAISVVAVGGVSARDRVVLGSHHFAPSGAGFGRVEPKRIYNGGDASGLIKRIHWRHWGHRVARGHGRTYIFKPQGGY